MPQLCLNHASNSHSNRRFHTVITHGAKGKDFILPALLRTVRANAVHGSAVHGSEVRVAVVRADHVFMIEWKKIHDHCHALRVFSFT